MLRIQLFLLTTTIVSYSACTSDQEPGAATPIRSTEDLSTYLRTAHDSPLDRLAPDARQRFLDSLTFGEHELGGFQYTDLQTLPPDDVYQILRLFGAERTAPMVLRDRFAGDVDNRAESWLRPRGDHEGYYCHSPHSCMENKGWICMTGC